MLEIQQSQSSLFPGVQNYTAPESDKLDALPQDKKIDTCLTDYYRDSLDSIALADRYDDFEAFHYDTWIKNKTNYDPELMRLYGATVDYRTGSAVPRSALGNNANKVDQDKINYQNLPVNPFGVNLLNSPSAIPDYVAKKTRYANYKIRTILQELQIQPKRCQTCAKHSIGDGSNIYIDVNNSVAKIDKIETCSSVWACPVCRSKILNSRQDELNTVAEKYRADGGYIHMLTLTIPHYKTESLAKTKDSILSIFKRLLQSKPWRAFKEYLDGYDRAIEITWGQKNGFHPHIHMLLYTPIEIDYQYWTDELIQQWFMLIETYLKKTANEHALDLRASENDDYLVKWAGVSEMTGIDQKTAKKKNYSISDLEKLILRGFNDKGDTLPLDKVCSILHEYYTETKGNRLLTHSQTKYKDGKSLKKYYLGDEKKDDELAKLDKDDFKSLIPIAKINDDGVKLLSDNNHFPDLKEFIEQHPVSTSIEMFKNQFPIYADHIECVENFSLFPADHWDRLKDPTYEAHLTLITPKNYPEPEPQDSLILHSLKKRTPSKSEGLNIPETSPF